METLTDLVYQFISVTLSLSLGCFFSNSVCKFVASTPVKQILYLLFLASVLIWAKDFLEMSNTPRFDTEGIAKEALLERKYSFAKLQRDVYMKFILAFTILAALCTSRAWERTVKLLKKAEENRHKSD
mmetsp:Transcript_34320/g.60084  ORF Transcript_34320/g.60084 Transcript_34320/m.60084 type:complete len:128 (+) Transcript_34320:891-1274(+)